MEIHVNTLNEDRFEYGQKIFIVEQCEYMKFTSKCEVCGGSGCIVLKGITFSCPNCNGSGKSSPVINISRYGVMEYDIYCVEIIGRVNKIERDGRWICELRDGLPMVKYGAVCTEGELSGMNITLKGEYKVDVDANEAFQEIMEGKKKSCEFIFTSIGKAKELVDVLNQSEESKLQYFNSQNGTDYDYQWRKNERGTYVDK